MVQCTRMTTTKRQVLWVMDLLLLCLLRDTFAWSRLTHVHQVQHTRGHAVTFQQSHFIGKIPRTIAFRLHQGSASGTVDETNTAFSAPNDFSEAEQIMLNNLYSKCKDVHDDKDSLQTIVLEALPTLPPNLLIKLRQSKRNHSNEVVRTVSGHINDILDARMEQAKETLTELLNAGEIRKLDALIGKAARSGGLDVAFFNVLTLNLQDAMAANGSSSDDNDDTIPEEEQQQQQQQQTQQASRLQILKHVYTRCQEEVEKTIPPATALLNKLLRTEQAAIRANLYSHYLTPQANTITTPDGKILELQGTQPVLVPLQDFIQAIETAVLQIRTIENAGGTDKESAAIMVESCRHIAREARIIVGDTYGRDSDELRLFEEGLQPVFRPSSPQSPYIQGVN